METLNKEKTVTTKELAESLGVDISTVQKATKSLGINAERVGSAHAMVFTESQATAIKIELQNHTKVAQNGFTTLTISNDLDMLLMQQKLNEYQTMRIAQLQAENEQQKQKLIEQKPKVEFFDDVTGSCDTIDMKEVAKLLNIKGLGRNKLFELLRNKKILDRNNQPYQKFVDLGYFRIIESRYALPTGEIKINLKTVVFQKGVDFIKSTVKAA